MRRPTRTRRLSIAAIVSLLLLVVVAGAAIRSLWIVDDWRLGESNIIWTLQGRIHYVRYAPGAVAGATPLHSSSDAAPASAADLLEFSLKIWPNYSEQLEADLPFIYPLLLLLIAPIRWLIARPANAPAFPGNPKQA